MARSGSDGVTAVEILPGYSWQSPGAYTPMNPCPVERIASPSDLLAMVVRALRPGARILDYRDRPDLTAQAQKTDMGGWRSHVGDLRIAYAAGGQPVEEILSATVSQNAMGGNAGYVLGYRAAAGRLEPSFLETVRSSMRGNPQYGEAIRRRGTDRANRYAAQQSDAISQWHNRRMAEINAKGSSDRAAIRAQGNSETNAIYAQTAAGTAATNDRMYDSNLRALREETTWINPTTGQRVQGSVHGGHRVLQLGDGSVTRTDDPYHGPAGSSAYQPE